MSAAHIALRPGYLCECITYTIDALNNPVTVAAFDAASPTQAVRWIRIAVRTLASTLGQDDFRDTWDWITGGHHDASDALSIGDPCTFVITYRTTRVEWTARPVLFLPMAPHQPTSPRACATEYPAHI